MTDQNISVGSEDVAILLGTSTQFRVQNLSSNVVRFKVKDSIAGGGELAPRDTYIFDYDIEVNCNCKQTKSRIYIVRD